MEYVSAAATTSIMSSEMHKVIHNVFVFFSPALFLLFHFIWWKNIDTTVQYSVMVSSPLPRHVRFQNETQKLPSHIQWFVRSFFGFVSTHARANAHIEATVESAQCNCKLCDQCLNISFECETAVKTARIRDIIVDFRKRT